MVLQTDGVEEEHEEEITEAKELIVELEENPSQIKGEIELKIETELDQDAEEITEDKFIIKFFTFKLLYLIKIKYNNLLWIY